MTEVLQSSSCNSEQLWEKCMSMLLRTAVPPFNATVHTFIASWDGPRNSGFLIKDSTNLKQTNGFFCMVYDYV